jgi:hypothetical protein
MKKLQKKQKVFDVNKDRNNKYNTSVIRKS